MPDLTALTAELHHERQLRMGAEKSNESLQRQVIERDETIAALEARLDACERAKRVYFLEAESNRKLLEQQQKYQCEGYIWGEPA